LGLKGLFPLWSQVRVLWLLIYWPLKAYMVINFKTRGISRGTCKLTQTLTLIKKIYLNHPPKKSIMSIRTLKIYIILYQSPYIWLTSFKNYLQNPPIFYLLHMGKWEKDCLVFSSICSMELLILMLGKGMVVYWQSF
jgi:hypothetical protein